VRLKLDLSRLTHHDYGVLIIIARLGTVEDVKLWCRRKAEAQLLERAQEEAAADYSEIGTEDMS
jgi:hypothetical protein